MPAYLLIFVVLLAIFARSIAGFLIEYEWWKEVGHANVWWSQLLYGTLPVPVTAAALFGLFWMVHARALKSGGARLRELPGYGTASTLVIAAVSFAAASALVQTRTILQFVGSRQQVSGEWTDPVFGRPLHFYFFELPFIQMLVGLALAAIIGVSVAYLVASRLAMVRRQFQQAREGPIDLAQLNLGSLFDVGFLRYAIPAILLLRAVSLYFDRYDLLFSDHGLLVGVDWVDERVRLPLMYAGMAASVLGAGLFFLRQRVLAIGVVVAAGLVLAFVPPIVYATYVRPTEISIQKPYIQRHIEATRTAYGIKDSVREMEYTPNRAGTKLDSANTKALLENVRLWDWQAFHDTVTQIQSLRPYYVFEDTDVDRYWLTGADGRKRIQQMMVTPRELDVSKIPEARSRWNNPHFVYTHGYGVVMAGASQITSDGLPNLLVKNAPPEVLIPDLKITRPEIYYGEQTHEPVFVRTGQPEFNYPSGSENVHSKYDGRGGIPVGSTWMRLMAAVSQADWNIMFTQFMTAESRMMIHRRVMDRLDTLASFVRWDSDPYLVVTTAGRLVWMADGFTQSNRHPYSKSVRRSEGPVNYLRNSVKATIDAYDGSIQLYVFDEQDPILRAYQGVFPGLFQNKAKMPADLRAHARYPERLFRIQAEIYRTYHMRDPESFYNKEDVWDVALDTTMQEGRRQSAEPSFIVATLPGEKEPEFLLTIPFTPRDRQNLVGLMLARCDGDKLGQFVVLQLSKQELIFGPMQIKARIDQDQNISKDLTLWNQQGSRVLRGQMMILPVENTFLYAEPIYIQAAQAPMPQLKKVAVALGNQLGYGDTYEQALAQVGASSSAVSALAAAVENKANIDAGRPATATAAQADPRVERLRGHMKRYRELMAQGKWSEAGRELEAVEGLLR